MDLEDAVPAPSKAVARAAARSVLSGTGMDLERFVVRINHPATPEGRADLDEIASAGCGRVTLMVPKVGGPSDVESVRRDVAVDGTAAALIPLIETAQGLAHVEEIALAEAVSGLQFGGLDLSIDLGCALEWEPLLYARSRTVHAARVAGVDAIDMPYLDVSDIDGLEREADRARRLGFTTKAAIHPGQVAVIDRVFAPTEDELDRARQVLNAFERDGAGAFLLDGTMIDRPAVEAARRLLSRSGTPDG
jgi:(S)-citramalyl-CoA lyase